MDMPPVPGYLVFPETAATVGSFQSVGPARIARQALSFHSVPLYGRAGVIALFVIVHYCSSSMDHRKRPATSGQDHPASSSLWAGHQDRGATVGRRRTVIKPRVLS
ncbi:hypothetical protein CALVIDRAFT_541893 [Calocera viscosa TUFC12733]|uniref:Uncharacterized protein n=1 Tax=Calocera viscosa (strain TUFC12733) TaxID=1330018 RepID=A0A167H906_CALVF|nr:hypothetical protein CALVIDRAFT_541893 [Calocera viscosa TUFC12733]